jgi:hypothetical protein
MGKTLFGGVNAGLLRVQYHNFDLLRLNFALELAALTVAATNPARARRDLAVLGGFMKPSR